MAKQPGNSRKFKIYRYWWLLCLCLSFLSVGLLQKGAAEMPLFPPAAMANNPNFGARIQRTMGLLAASTPAQRQQVRILFYGQSITQQDWWQDVAQDLKQRFPSADLIVENRAIGGFSAPILIRPSEHDLYPFYPDLLIFHVYGGGEDYEAIIANVRRRTTSEILLHSDHIDWMPTGKSDDPEQLKRYEWHNTHSTKWLPELADKYGCEIAEIRTPWLRYLKDNRLQPQQLLSDSIHLNSWGNFLLAALIKPHLRYNPNLPQTAQQDLVKTYTVGKDVKWQDGKLVLEFEGNRIDAIADRTFKGEAISAKIAIDGKKPSEFPELYSITRPSPSLGVGWPAIIQISHQKPLIVEDWKAVITDINSDASKFKFDVIGSKTGYDGSGTNEEMFVSKSGRVAMEPKNWWLQNAYEYSKTPTPKGFEIFWQVKPMFVDSYILPQIADSSREYPTTLAQNLSNSKHILEIIPETDGTVPIKEIRVYRPPYIPAP
ncbi:SGNH/GDSL hydrolase family protein [Microcoleus sp. herbarium12]|uniref:SGNH/GDSL hydrolase family protein n=1 Tax=Microcoleus sp. herbarium12 TaxID=3055437 RepID=UPI002FD5FF02